MSQLVCLECGRESKRLDVCEDCGIEMCSKCMKSHCCDCETVSEEVSKAYRRFSLFNFLHDLFED